MALYSKTLTQLRHELAKLVDDYVVGTSDTNSSTTSIVDTELGMYVADHFNGFEVCGYGLTGAPVSTVTDFAVAAGVGTLTLVPAMTGMTSAKTYELHDPGKRWSKAQYDAAINMAINNLSQVILLDKIDETLDLVASTFEYSLPTGFVSVSAVYMETSTANKWEADQIPHRLWKLVNKATPIISFDTRDWAPTAGRGLRLIGQGRQAELSAESDTCTLPTHVVLTLAHAYLLRTKEKYGEAQAIQVAAEREAFAYRMTPYGRMVNV